MAEIPSQLGSPFPRRPKIGLLLPVLLGMLSTFALAQSETPAPSRPTWLQSGSRKNEIRIEQWMTTAGKDLWVVRRRNDQKFEVFYRGLESLTGLREDGLGRPGRLQRILLSPGHPVAASASNNTCYVIYDDFSAQSIRVQTATDTQPLPLINTIQLPPFPEDPGVRRQLRGWAAGTAGPIALYREERAGQFSWKLFRLDAAHRSWLEIPVSLALQSTDRLDLVMVDDSTDHFVLVASNAESVRVHSPSENGWQTVSYAGARSEASRFTHLKNSLIQISPETSGEQTSLNMSLLRAGERVDLGLLGVIEPGVEWQAVRAGEEIGLLLIDPEQNLKWLRRGLQAPQGPSPVPQPIELATDPPIVWDPMTTVLISAVLLSMLLMLGASRRDPSANRPRLPRTLQAAGLGRIAAAMIDLVIPLGLVMLWTGEEDPSRILSTWMQTPTHWRDLSDSLFVVALYLAHTTLGEALTGASIGKRLFGCRVTDLAGSRPKFWQILVRNLFKAVELMPPFMLLILPLMNRHRQRLGDFVGRTVVVAPRDEEQESDFEDEMD